LSLVLLGFTPVMGGLVHLLTVWGKKDGFFGQQAYEQAASTATEALSNVRTVFSLNAETKMSAKYDSLLQRSERAAIHQSDRASFLTALLLFVMFSMYGFGFWYGAVIIAKSTEKAMFQHPAPPGLFDNSSPEYESHRTIIYEFCSDYTHETLAVCACGLPWDSMNLESPDCGCGFDSGDMPTFGTSDECFTGGKTMLVFFALLFGGFALGQISPGVKALSDARAAAAKMLKVIERRPSINAEITEGKVRLARGSVRGDITLENLHFRYSSGDESNLGDGYPVFGGCNLTIKAGETVALGKYICSYHFYNIFTK